MKTEIAGKQYYTYPQNLVIALCAGFPASFALSVVARYQEWYLASLILSTLSIVLAFAMGFCWYFQFRLNEAVTRLRIDTELEVIHKRQEQVEWEIRLRRQQVLDELGITQESTDYVQ